MFKHLNALFNKVKKNLHRDKRRPMPPPPPPKPKGEKCVVPTDPDHERIIKARERHFMDKYVNQPSKRRIKRRKNG